MNDTTIGLQLAGLALSAVVAVLAFSLRRNISDLDRSIGRVETDLRSVSGKIETHSASLAMGTEKFRQLEIRVNGLEERERERGCYGDCVKHDRPQRVG